MLVLVLVVAKFFQEFVHLSLITFAAEESRMVLYVLSLVDLVMVANLTVMVIISGYENFVSRIDPPADGEQLSWFGKLDAGSLKIKLAVVDRGDLLDPPAQGLPRVGSIPNEKLVMLVGHPHDLRGLGDHARLARQDRLRSGAKAPKDKKEIP